METKQLVEECLLKPCAERTPSIIFGQLHLFSSRPLTSAFLLKDCLFTSLLDYVWYADVIRCSTPVSATSSVDTKFTNSRPYSFN